MDKQYIEENDIAVRYLRRQLTPEETLEFEAYLIDKPELVKKLELDNVLIKNMPRVMDMFEKNKPGKNWFIRLPWQASLATIAICFVAAQFIVLGYFEQAGQQDVVISDVKLNYVEPMRNVEQRTIGEYAISDGLVVLSILPADPGAMQFDVSIYRQDTEEPVYEINGIEPQNTGEIVIALNVRSLGAGDYRMELKPQLTDTAPDQYLFSITGQ